MGNFVPWKEHRIFPAPRAGYIKGKADKADAWWLNLPRLKQCSKTFLSIFKFILLQLSGAVPQKRFKKPTISNTGLPLSKSDQTKSKFSNN